MPRLRKPTKHDEIEAAIKTAGSIGALERLAGIGRSHEERSVFWLAFCRMPGAEGLDAGVAELKRRIRALGIAPGRPAARTEVADA